MVPSHADNHYSKPIRRPALKQVLKKFSTIPEETETSSLTPTKSTPELNGDKTTDTSAEAPAVNGTTPT
jgi:osomolarity two-component system sensor histidine kinase SLN1